MAEAPDPIEKGLEELDEEIICPVCQEHFRDPKILPCLHYYCKECIRQLVLRAGANRRPPLRTPSAKGKQFCLKMTPINCPRRFLSTELRTKMEKVQGKMEAVCELCSRAKAEAFCRQCTEFICSDCVKLHGVWKVFAGHKVVT